MGVRCMRGGVESESVLDRLDSGSWSGVFSSVGDGGGRRWCDMRDGGIHVVYGFE